MNMSNASTERQSAVGLACKGCRDREAEIKRLRDLVRRVRNQLLSKDIQGLHLGPIEVASAVRDDDAETERLIAKAAEAGGE